MAKSLSPTIETTKDFILIKIPRTLFRGDAGLGKFSVLERGLVKSLRQSEKGEVRGPFSSVKDFLADLKKPVR